MLKVLLEGRQSRAADVYAFGIVLWELYTGGRAFADVPSLLLGAQVAHDGKRPIFPPGDRHWGAGAFKSNLSMMQPCFTSTSTTPHCLLLCCKICNILVHCVTPAAVDAPIDYVDLAERCWRARPEDRPSFEEISTAILTIPVAGLSHLPGRSSGALMRRRTGGGGGGGSWELTGGPSEMDEWRAIGNDGGGGAPMIPRQALPHGAARAAAAEGASPVERTIRLLSQIRLGEKVRV